MTKKKLKHKKKQSSSNSGILRCCFGCVSKNPDDKHSVKSNRTKNSSSHKDAKTKKHKPIRKSSKIPVKSELELRQISPTNVLLSQAYLEKIESSMLENEKSANNINTENRAEKDELVKTILSKYLQARREGMLNVKSDTQEETEENYNSLQPKNSDFLNVECLSSDSSETLILQDEPLKKIPPKARAEYPIKSKSAPTNSAAHDSLADICFKMSKYKQQENKSDSYVTCCSEENSTDCAITKRKLELVFNQSSDEISPCDDNSSISLQYKISYKKSRSDGIVQKKIDGGSYEYVIGHSRETKTANQELYLHPFAEGEIGGANGSSSSLKWKLIISHHGHGDFR